ncbi:alpha/beta hydrolase [Micromonospora olivasterospora]|uniref:Proline iminopeptidase n=1 Tax=Micromonospora olivasterospora TaxID=1880 RepID=A0A562IFV7_MICOL|nr:alpha/beta hydrolase [Micromonospora olivasterospora]TWH69899.1 proline iminopeptidase [Micromonospora olivasterospora]
MTVLRIAGALAILVVAIGVAWSAVFGVARVSDRPAVFLAAGLAAYAAVLAAGGWLLTQRLPDGTASRARAVGAAVAAILVLLPAAWALLAPNAPHATRDPAGLRHWALPDGARLAALLVPARPRATGDPIVFLHGDPGVADMDHDAPVLGRLAGSGRDVWLYDQRGAGRSSRLADPAGYSLERDVADLEEVRRRIGTDRMVLIGHSYGATLAANYLARHPERVSRVVFYSPGRLVPQVGDVSGNGMLGRLDTRQRLAVLGSTLSPRAMLTWSLVRANPRAAHAFSGDAEMDARFATLYRQAAPGLVCADSPAPPAPARPGFYANQVPLASTRQADDIRPALAGLRVPALILKGACDYLPWSFAADYQGSVPGSRLIFFDRSGHQIHLEQEAEFLAVVRAFLADAPSPLPPWSDAEPPPNYQGAR